MSLPFPDSLVAPVRPLLPGVLLSATVAGAAWFLSDHYGAPVMLFALLIGMAFNFLAEDARFTPGLDFSSKSLLRLGIVLIGARVTFGEIAALGWPVLATVTGLILCTIAAGFAASRLFGKGWRFALLTGGSVAICGASAALAIASVIPHNDKTERNTVFTVVAVTTLSTIAMIVYPILFKALALSDTQAGFLVGATIHDVAQVVGAGYSISPEAGDTATVVKLMRVTMLPVVLLVVLLGVSLSGAGRAAGAGRAIKLPWFVVGFGAMCVVNSLGLLPVTVVKASVTGSGYLLVIAIAALGIRTSLKAMAKLGITHPAVVLAETVALLAMALAAVELFDLV